jgi:hypothetical protein
MDSLTIDTSRWPIVVHTATGVPTKEMVDDYLRTATAILARKEPHVAILDARGVGRAHPYIRARSREWMRAHRPEVAAWCKGTVYLVSSSAMRFLVMTSILMTRLPTPYRVCESLEEAMEWARERLGA